MNKIFLVLVGLSFPSIALANLPRTSPSVTLLWWSFFLSIAFVVWGLVAILILMIKATRKEKIILPKWMKVLIFTPIFILVVGAIFGQYFDHVETRENEQCVTACLTCAPESGRARMVEWGGKQVTPACEVWENTCEHWHTCAMLHCGFEPIRPITEYCPK